jgi:hypothetical protein
LTKVVSCAESVGKKFDEETHLIRRDEAPVRKKRPGPKNLLALDVTAWLGNNE